MTKAASLLHVAQPALGLQIRQLEESLGTVLLERHSRGVSITPAGQLLYQRACTILDLIDKAEAEVKALGKDQKERVALFVTPSIMRLIGSDVLVAARRDIPQVQLSLVEEPSNVILTALERSECDLALTYEVRESAHYSAQPLLEEELLLVTRPEVAPEGTSVSFAQALERELVLAHERDMIRKMVAEEATAQHLPVKLAYEVQSLQATLQVVLEGMAASILPFGVVANELRNGTLAARRISEPALKRRLYLVRSLRRGPFENDEAISKLLRSAVKQLVLDLGDLAVVVSS